MAIRLGSRRDLDGNVTNFYDTLTDETTMRVQPAVLDEDFVGPGHTTFPSAGSPAAGYPWVKKTVQTGGTPAVAPVSNAPGGVVRLSIDATSEKQEATLYANDALNWDVRKGLVWECRAAFQTLPSAAAVEIVMGLQSAWIDGPDNATRYVEFQAQANGAINLRTKDGTNTLSVASGVTLTAGNFSIFRIDATDVTNILFFIDGVKVSPTVAANFLKFADTGTTAILQPYCSVYKASGTGVGALDVDAIQAGMNRS